MKAGSGAFMRTRDEARSLASACLALARGAERPAAAAVTDMSQPLGDAVGNALDIVETVAILRGEERGRLRELAVWFAARAVERLDGGPFEDSLARAEAALDDGSALDRFRRMVQAQGGDPRVVDDAAGVLPRAPVVVPLLADRAGIVSAVAADRIGIASGALGAGRLRKGDPIDPAVGIVMRPKIGDRVEVGETLGEVHARTDEDANEAVGHTLAALTLVEHEVEPPPLVHDWLPG